MEKLRLQLVEDCNKSGLPIEAVLFVVRDVYRDVLETYNKAVESEKAQSEDKEENE